MKPVASAIAMCMTRESITVHPSFIHICHISYPAAENTFEYANLNQARRISNQTRFLKMQLPIYNILPKRLVKVHSNQSPLQSLGMC